MMEKYVVFDVLVNMCLYSVLEKLSRNYIVFRNSRAWYHTEKVNGEKEKTKKEKCGLNIHVEITGSGEM